MTNIKYSKRFKLRNGEYCDIAEKRIASVGKDIPLFEAD